MAATRRIALLGPYGFGNLGDAAIQDAAIAGIRARHPDAEIHGISLNPADTEARHGIPAHPLHPGSPTPPRGLRRVIREPAFGHHARRLLSGFDLLVISGGGQLDDSWGGPWRHPFALLRWCTVARLAGTPVVFLSVGAGPVTHRLSRGFFRWALARAWYRSFRDEESRALVRSLGLADGPVVPDLAYGLSPSGPAHPTGVVGVSPMPLFDPRAWPERDADAYHAYLAGLAGLVDRLLAAGRRVELFATNVRMDRAVLDDLRQLLGGRVSEARIGTVADVLDRLAGYDYVVASRYHAALLAQTVGTPVVALSYHPKVRALMAAAGQDAYCLDARPLDPERVMACVRALEARRAVEAARLRDYAARCRDAVERQFDLVFGPRPAAVPAEVTG